MRVDNSQNTGNNKWQDAASPARTVNKRGHGHTNTVDKLEIEDSVIVLRVEGRNRPETSGPRNHCEENLQKPENEIPLPVEDEVSLSEAQEEISEDPFADESGVSAQSAAGGFGMGSSSPTDSSGELTRRLVAAQDTFAVQTILTEAYKNIGSLRMIAATGSEDDVEIARAIIKKLEKVASRSRRKIKDLGKEAQLLQKQMKAEREEKTQKTKEIKAELRKREMERKRREQGYLHDADEEALANNGGTGDSLAANKLDAATEARIAAQAEAMALTEVAAASESGSTDAEGLGGGGQSATGESSDMGGADAAMVAASDAGGSVDVAV